MDLVQSKSPPAPIAEPDDELRARLAELCTEGWAIVEQFETDVRDRVFHPFIAADYELVLAALVANRGTGVRFLEWGSASGIIAIMADLLGYEAYGIEIDISLVTTARALAARFNSKARFVAGSFLPTGYEFRARIGGERSTTIGDHESGYLQLGHALDDFDVVFGYPWGGEAPMMLDLMRCYGKADGLLLLFGVNDGVKAYRAGREVAPAR